MSRIGKRPVAVPSGVTATVDGQTVKMKGPKGQLQFVVHDDVEVKFESGQVNVAPRHETNRARALYGTARAQIANLVAGVTKGFEKRLEINGVGYRAALQGKNLQLALGYSHDVIFRSRKGSRSRCRSQPRSSSSATTASASARSQPKSAAIARRSPIRARA